ncbi:MAG: HPF/RaiA family ribosome-associated protein [Deltaproteobacteria bacterium]|nr:HPF/RaiA family ribosome-associated protein [Deltaproteobacteria bacterium]
MKIHIRSRALENSKSLHEHIERRVHFALGRFSARIGTVTVMIEDLNGPRGGVDKQCRMTAALTYAGHLRVEVRDTNVSVAADRAADRLGRAVANEIGRSHSYPQQRALMDRIGRTAALQM